MAGMRLGQDVARADVEKKPGVSAWIDEQILIRDVKQQRQAGTDQRCHCVEEQHHRRSSPVVALYQHEGHRVEAVREVMSDDSERDRQSTRLNSSHAWISYAVFCLK